MSGSAALTDIVAHAIATGSKSLSMSLGVEVAFTDSTVLDGDPRVGETGEKLVSVDVRFTEGIEGTTSLVLTSDEAGQMVELMLAGTEYDESDVFGELGMSALGEAMNVFVEGIGQALAQQKGYQVTVGTPQVRVVTSGTIGFASSRPGIIVALEGTIGSTPGRLYWSMDQETAAALTRSEDVMATQSTSGAQPAMPAHAAQAAAPLPSATPSELGRLADVTLDVTVELGRSRIPIRELLALDEGGVIRLGRPVGEPVDLLVNGLATARGEIVVVDGRLGLRITELIA